MLNVAYQVLKMRKKAPRTCSQAASPPSRASVGDVSSNSSSLSRAIETSIAGADSDTDEVEIGSLLVVGSIVVGCGGDTETHEEPARFYTCYFCAEMSQ